MIAKNNLSTLITADVKSAHAELLAALGTENNPTQWMLFMQAVTKLLPEILKEGRPKAEEINASIIGRLGFSSWQAMIEAPVDAQGLGWNISAWKAWRRAWNVVQANQWLLEAGLTSSEVNTLAQECKTSKFPSGLDEYEELKKGRAAALEQSRANSISKLRQQAKEAETKAEEATTQAKVLKVINDNYESKENKLLDNMSTLKAENANLLAQINTLTTQIETLKNQEPIKLTRLQHFLAIFQH